MKQLILIPLLAGLLSIALSAQNSTCLIPSGAMQQPGDPNPTCFPGHSGPNSGSLTQYYTFIATSTEMAINLTPILGTSCSFPNTAINYTNLVLYETGNCTVLITTGASFSGLTVGTSYTWGVTMTPVDPVCVWIAQACPRALQIPPVLPENSINLAGRAGEKKILLEWETPEVTSAHAYYIERKAAHTSDFFPVGHIPSSESEKLQFSDIHPVAGRQFYRVSAVSPSGEVTYSNQIEIEFEGSRTGEISVFPNPTTGEFTLKTPLAPEKEVNLVLRDIHGKSIPLGADQIQSLESKVLALPSHLPAGMYWLTLSTKGGFYQTRIVKL